MCKQVVWWADDPPPLQFFPCVSTCFSVTPPVCLCVFLFVAVVVFQLLIFCGRHPWSTYQLQMFINPGFPSVKSQGWLCEIVSSLSVVARLGPPLCSMYCILFLLVLPCIPLYSLCFRSLLSVCLLLTTFACLPAVSPLPPSPCHNCKWKIFSINNKQIVQTIKCNSYVDFFELNPLMSNKLPSWFFVSFLIFGLLAQGGLLSKHLGLDHTP